MSFKNSLIRGSTAAASVYLMIVLSTPLHSAPTHLIREIPLIGLSDLAIASYDNYGPVIYFNPELARQLGPWLTEFFRAHELGHHKLGHLQRERFAATPFNRAWLRQSYEREADCYAAQHISPYAVMAAIEYFVATQGPTRPDWQHPTGYERVAVIRDCAGEP